MNVKVLPVKMADSVIFAYDREERSVVRSVDSPEKEPALV